MPGRGAIGVKGVESRGVQVLRATGALAIRRRWETEGDPRRVHVLLPGLEVRQILSGRRICRAPSGAGPEADEQLFDGGVLRPMLPLLGLRHRVRPLEEIDQARQHAQLNELRRPIHRVEDFVHAPQLEKAVLVGLPAQDGVPHAVHDGVQQMLRGEVFGVDFQVRDQQFDATIVEELLPRQILVCALTSTQIADHLEAVSLDGQVQLDGYQLQHGLDRIGIHERSAVL
mmetsp:Transcript_59675/g.106426  ORF Transcript_59675/g.106426 Transcript_59675/m.106426 type:complete len:229 (+) Transcript_59675:2193-2879(+)